MTSERLEEIRKEIAAGWHRSGSVAQQLLAEVDWLRPEIKRLSDMAENQAAEIRLLRDDFDPRLLAKEIELQQLRAAIERVKALDRYDCKDEYMALWPDGDWIDRDDVLAALEESK